MNIQYKAIRPKLWEIIGTNGRALGRIRHVFRPQSKTMVWEASNGAYYGKAEEAVAGLTQSRKEELKAAFN